jgi:hypothetical protein
MLLLRHIVYISWNTFSFKANLLKKGYKNVVQVIDRTNVHRIYCLFPKT